MTSLITRIRRTIVEGDMFSTIDSLLILAQHLLRVFVILLSADVAMVENVRIMQEVVNTLERLLQSLSNDINCDKYGYYMQVHFTGDRGRPKLKITKPILEYFLGHGFSATSTARLLHISLSTICHRMVDFGMMIRSQYSDISDEDLDRMIRSIHIQTAGL